MIINYHKEAVNDLKKIEPLQALMLIDYFEHKFKESTSLNVIGKVFISGLWRILYVEENNTVTVLRVIQ